MRLCWAIVVMMMGCSDDNWKPYTAERDYLECQFQVACSESSAGLDCEAYIDQYTPRPNPCERFDAFYAEACIDQMEDLIDQVNSDRTSCPTDSTIGAPACTQAFIVATGGQCR